LVFIFAITRSGKRIVKFGTKYCGKPHNSKLLESESMLAFRFLLLYCFNRGRSMLNLIINAIGIVCVVMLVWCLVRAYSRNTQQNSQADPISIEDYLQKITRIAGLSVYDTFHISAEEWRVSADRIEQDFERYLSSQTIPYYLKDFVRKGQKHIDELYRGKGRNFSDKRLLLFYLCLTLFFWGGAVILSLYVIPYFVPLEVRSAFLIGPR
jgi:hypothetical protein